MDSTKQYRCKLNDRPNSFSAPELSFLPVLYRFLLLNNGNNFVSMVTDSVVSIKSVAVIR